MLPRFFLCRLQYLTTVQFHVLTCHLFQRALHLFYILSDLYLLGAHLFGEQIGLSQEFLVLLVILCGDNRGCNGLANFFQKLNLVIFKNRKRCQFNNTRNLVLQLMGNNKYTARVRFSKAGRYGDIFFRNFRQQDALLFNGCLAK
jgi:hypothetical protein